ncbi:UvrD-like DNA helicase [Gemmatirosa kalamazoonensis]|uniref:DNA 3'-5' helicase n=1 Tax=Gemmatirosa kalamazoonensis TaxID=861299 RepID=W0RI07_9BACT|nr:UvrD-helicase domain-containing protein [Gemmatirosa kalamazoonensis]AHG90714.1 UvrD-like DNA helicase [Gemmatirosa kalamazoonensis]
MSHPSTPAGHAGAPRRDPLDGLNPAQRDAVLHVDGPALVLAGAGSGKTRVLTTRIARLVEHHGVDPSQILAVTFTNKAAGEMRERIARLLGYAPVGMWVGTFHAIGARMLRAHAHSVGRTPSFTIYDEDDTTGAIKRLLERHGVSPKDTSPKSVASAISDAKNQLVPASEYDGLAKDPFAKTVSLVFKDLEPAMRQANAVSFDDLLILPVQILRENAHVLEQYRKRFRYILVDEYQDTNRAQFEFVRLLGGESGNVMVVGDEDQSVYGWRGADIRNILDFTKTWPDAKVVRLEENYRSTPNVLELANVVIVENKERLGKTLRATRAPGERVSLVGALDDRDEADYVIEEISTRRATEHRLLRDFAILYRTNAQSRSLEEALRKRGFPYRLVGAVRFYDRREIRDLMAYLKLVANPADNEAFRRVVNVPKRGIGDTSVDMLAGIAERERVPLLEAARRPDVVSSLRPAARTALAEFIALVDRLRASAAEASVDELLRDLVAALKYGDHLKAEGPDWKDRELNVQSLIDGAAETVADEGGEVGLTPLDHFLQKATLVAGVDALDANADAVTLMTMHNAKGLEFPVVFITGLEDGLFPLARAYDEPAQLEEERRLFYVGITRAEEKLVLTHAEQRLRNGERMQSRPSGFLDGIPDGLVERRMTMKARSSGRAFLSDFGGGRRGGGRDAGSRWGGGRRERAWDDTDEQTSSWTDRAASRRPGAPVSFPAGGARRSTPATPDPSEESQDAAMLVPGARVRHRKFGAGTIAEISGAGRDAKVRIDFDDETIGRKTLVVAQANLEREWD